MNVRAVAIFCCLLAVGPGQALLLGGCSSVPRATADGDTGPAPWENARLPRLMLNDAVRSEVRALAMGAARSRGWQIGESADDRFAARRPLDPASPLTAAVGATGAPRGSAIEVTSYFVEQPGGVLVVLRADRLTPVTGKDKAQGELERIDYTDTFRATLEQSLQALRANYANQRARVARAAPPPSGEARAVSGDAPAVPPPVALAPAANAPADLPPAPAPRAEREAPPPATAWGQTAAAAPAAPAAPMAMASAAPSPQPVTAPGGGAVPAPVVDASPLLGSRAAPPASGGANPMLSLSQPTRGAVTWTYYAEQYARLHGCQVAPSGAVLIETRKDGELHRVPCAGSDSILVLCQSGTCRGLL